jgi:acyl-ACP thioesterase
MTSRRPEAFSAPYRVRFDEAGPDGLARTSTLLRFAQDVAWHHSDARGYDRAWYAERGLAWLVRTADVTVTAPIRVGSVLTATTSVIGWRRVWARRLTELHDGTRQPVGTVQIDWVLLDRRRAPTRIPVEFEPVFGAATTNLTLARVGLDDPPAHALVTRIEVRPQELDPMDHVNNAVYADWLDEQVIRAGDEPATRALPRRMRLEYAAAADRSAGLAATTWRDDGGWSFFLREADGADVLRARLEADPERKG